MSNNDLQRIYEQMMRGGPTTLPEPKTKPAPTRPAPYQPAQPKRSTPFGPRPDRVGKPMPKPKNDNLKDRIKSIFQKYIK
jgi:hypothetical protein